MLPYSLVNITDKTYSLIESHTKGSLKSKYIMTNTSPKKKKNILPLPSQIRNELRMTCALHGYSELKSGLKKNYSTNINPCQFFFHGKPPNHPSQIHLLAEGRLKYSCLFESIQIKTTSKKSKDSTLLEKLKLKQLLSRDNSRNYFSGIDIRAKDLEKKTKNGCVLITGRNLYDLAIKGMKYYKKALAYNEVLWDSEKMCPKKSGHTVDDCIDYVRKRMYFEDKKRKDDDESIPEDDEDHNEGVDNEDKQEDISNNPNEESNMTKVSRTEKAEKKGS